MPVEFSILHGEGELHRVFRTLAWSDPATLVVVDAIMQS